jgi:hypothetical protein
MDAEIQARKDEISKLFISGVMDLQDKYEALIPLLESKANLCKTESGADSPSYANALLELASYQSLAGRKHIAAALARDALRIHELSSGLRGLSAVRALLAVAEYLPSGAPETGEILRKAVEIRTKELGQDSPETAMAAQALVRWLRTTGQKNEADEIDRWLVPQDEARLARLDGDGMPYHFSWSRLVKHFPMSCPV